VVRFTLNGAEGRFDGDAGTSLLAYLRGVVGLTAAKDGCSGEGTCGACLVEIDGRPRLACRTLMRGVEGRRVVTLEGIPAAVRDALARAFVACGAVQCGFCTPGLVMRAKLLLDTDPDPAPATIRKALAPHLCRCTGYQRVIEAVRLAAASLRDGVTIRPAGVAASVGSSGDRRGAFEAASGRRLFVEDLRVEGMLHGCLRLSDHPRARVIAVDATEAASAAGVRRVFTAADVPGARRVGLIVPDWPVMVAAGETVCCVGDVLAGVVADTPERARAAAALVRVEYVVLPPVSGPEEAMRAASALVHEDRPNVLEECVLSRGDAEEALAASAYVSGGRYSTQRIEHAFLEREAALAVPGADGIVVYSQGQGVYEDRRQIAAILGVAEAGVRVVSVPAGGAFGGKEDLTVQGHAALFASLLGAPVKVALSRSESIRMHPKRHPVVMDLRVGASRDGRLTALSLRAVGDTGAYASVGTKVMERIAGHATGGYHVPAVDVRSLTVYTNNVPSGAMRGFGVPQVTFALEACIDDLCAQGGFDRWQFRWDNALVDGLPTATGQHVEAAGVRRCLEALREDFRAARFAGIAAGIKNCGIGNGGLDESTVRIDVLPEGRVTLHHGWSEMGQGLTTVAVQVLCQETSIDPERVEVVVDTDADLGTGMTTASRATVLAGNAIRDACRALRTDLARSSIESLAGRSYAGRFACDWTVKPMPGRSGRTHLGYGYAAQLCILDDRGEVEAVIAAHDAGRAINPAMFAGQIEGAVHMGLGYALTEDLPMEGGRLVSDRLADCGVLRATEMPRVEVRAVEVPDPVGPYGAKGVGEIGLVPTAAAVANALRAFDGIRRYSLPLRRPGTMGSGGAS
jgi:aldehyde oxidoreductase